MSGSTFLHDLAVSLRFLSRLPVPALPGETNPHAAPDFACAARAIPLAGAILGAIGGAALALANLLGLPPFACGLVAVGALALATGCFHEDGLADTADGLGGASPERRLEIMKDSRIGTFGAAALVVVLLLRASLAAELLARHGPLAAAFALIASGAVSRTAAVWLSLALPPARPAGAAFGAGRPTAEAFRTAVLLAALVLVAFPGATAGPWAILAALAAAAATAHLMARLSRAQFGGQTGDVAGATQQLGETAMLAALLVLHRPAGS
jgi:adenosylcobinamide-GDP ribazoletransferase